MSFSVCYVIESGFPSGTRPSILEYVTNTSKLGIAVHVICCGGKNERKTETIDGIHIYRLPINEANIFSELHFIVKAYMLLKRIVEKEQINIVQVHAGLHALLCLSLKLSLNIKIVYFLLTVNLRLPRPLEMIIQQIYTKISDSVIVLDKLMQDYIFGKRGQRNVFIVPIGVDLKRFKPNKEPALRADLKVHENECLLGYIGTLHPYRRLHNLVFAFQKVLNKYPNAKLVFIGDGSDSRRLITLVRSLGITEKVVFVGRVNYQDVHRYLNILDVGISYIPIIKTYNVQPPLKIFEYLSCGLPTICTKTMASRKLIKHGENGILCGDSPLEVSEAIIKLLGNEELIDKIRKNARKSILSYSWEKITRGSLLDIYKSTLTQQN